MALEELLLAGAGASVAIAVVAYVYHRVTGEPVQVDVDQDGEDDIELEEGEPFESEPVEETIDYASEAAQEIGGELAKVKGLGETKAEALVEAGFEVAEDLYFADDEELLDVTGIGETTVERIREHIGGSDE
jgi:hypothetical protein